MNIQANKAMQSSMPIIRPMWMLNPKSQLSLSIDDQLFVGDSVCWFLVFKWNHLQSFNLILKVISKNCVSAYSISSSSPRLDELPDDVAYEFTYGGRAQLFHYYYKLKHPEELSATVWMEEHIDKLRSEFRSNKLFGSYGVEVVEDISQNIDKHMKNYVSLKN